MIDMAIPGVAESIKKKEEKISKLRDLKIEVERLWKKATVVSVVIGA